MRRPVWLLFALAAALIVSIPAISLATPDVGEKDNGWSKTDERYQVQYEACVSAADCDYGRNLLDDGLSSGEPATETRLEDAWLVMDRQLHPAKYAPEPEPTPVAAPVSESVAPAPAPTTSVAPSSASGGYAIPEEIVMCESGGNYNASNPSGAYGAYQIMPGTAAAYSCDLSTPAGQDECAARIYADVGSSAWVCAG